MGASHEEHVCSSVLEKEPEGTAISGDREQTQAIHRVQRESQTLEGLLRKRKRVAVMKLHSAAFAHLVGDPIRCGGIRQLEILASSYSRA